MSVLHDETKGNNGSGDSGTLNSPSPEVTVNGVNGHAPTDAVVIPLPGRKLSFQEAHAQTMSEFHDALRRLAE